MSKKKPKTLVGRPRVVAVKPSSYQPTAAELKADVGIDAPPEEIARRLMCPVVVVEDRR